MASGGEPHRHQPGRTDNRDFSRVQVRLDTVVGSNSGADLFGGFTTSRPGSVFAEPNRRPPAWPELRSALPSGFWQRSRPHDRGQVEAMNWLMAAATSAGCSSATQCPLSAMMVVATW